MGLTFQQENNELLKAIIYSKLALLKNTAPDTADMVELYITGDCNQKCEYCYLVRHGDQLYPHNLRKKDIIIKNLKIFLDFLIEKDLVPRRIDLFSGEILGTPLGNEVLDVLLDYVVTKGLNIKTICIPSNMSFCLKQETIERINEYIKHFKQYNVNISISCSMDGLIADKYERPFNNNTDKLKTKEYYNRILSFCSHHNFGFHPMISANSLKYQKENYKIWLEILHLLYPDEELFKSQLGKVMQLEVRNDDWTEEHIKEYIDWLNFLIDIDKKEYFDNDNKNFFDELYTKKFEQYKEITYLPYCLFKFKETSCTIGKMVCVRLGDLAICPCHRTSYDKYILGKFVVDNDKIVDIKANNVQLASAIYLTSALIKPKCNECSINLLCVKGCLGSQYETTNDIFYPVESVCQLEKVKNIFLYYKFKKMMEESNIKNSYPLIKELNIEVEKLLEQEDFNKWITFIQSLI